MTDVTYVDHDPGAVFVHGHVHLRTTARCLTGDCANIPLRDRIAAALNSGTVIDAIERLFESELRLRTDALNRTGASNDQLRARVARLDEAIDRARMERAQAEDAETEATARAEAAEARVAELETRLATVEAKRRDMHRLALDAKSTDSRLTFRWIAEEFDAALGGGGR